MNKKQKTECPMERYSSVDELPKSGRVAWETIQGIVPFKRKAFIKLGVSKQAPYPYFYTSLERVMFDALELRRWFENMLSYRHPVIHDDVVHMDGALMRDGYITNSRELRLVRDYKRATYTLKREAERRQRQFTGNLRKPFGETVNRAGRMQAIERTYPCK